MRNQMETNCRFWHIRQNLCFVLTSDLCSRGRRTGSHSCRRPTGVGYPQLHSTGCLRNYLDSQFASFWTSCCCYQTTSKPVDTDRSMRYNQLELCFWHLCYQRSSGSSAGRCSFFCSNFGRLATSAGLRWTRRRSALSVPLQQMKPEEQLTNNYVIISDWKVISCFWCRFTVQTPGDRRGYDHIRSI